MGICEMSDRDSSIHKGSQELFNSLVEALHAGATDALPWFLTQQQRWRWLIDTLMGHPRIRGGQRPRDFPTDPASRRAVSCAADLHTREVPAWNRISISPGQKCSFGSWLYAYALMLEGRVFPACTQPELAAQEGTQWILWQILRITGRDAEEGSLHRILAALGIAPKEAQKLSGIPKPPANQCWRCIGDCRMNLGIDADCRSIVGIAAEAAFIAGTAALSGTNSIEEAAKHNRVQIKALLDTQVWLVSLKTHKVQERIERANRLYVARGASVWASQALALGRELLIDDLYSGRIGLPKLMLLNDVDAIAKFACFEEPHCQSIAQIVESRLGNRVAKNNPRLLAILDSQSKAWGASFDITTCLPNFCIETDYAGTIWDMCSKKIPLEKKALKEEKQKKEQQGTRCILSFDETTLIDDECGLVRGDRGLTPIGEIPWLAVQKENTKVGWNGIVWSLAGGTYLAGSIQGLGESIGFDSLVLRNQHKEWLECLDEQNGQVAYIKLDGDQVGHSLAVLPGLSAFTAGLDIFDKTQLGLREGILAALGAWTQERRIPTLPIELVYMGGDDVMCNLPSRYLDGFLSGFERAAKPAVVKSFSGVVIEAPANINKELGKKIPEVASRLVPKALKWMKAYRRGDNMEVFLSDLDRISKSYGFNLSLVSTPTEIGPTLTVWHFRLLQSTGKESLISRAQRFAMDKHASICHLRKYTGVPYSMHLAAVAKSVESVENATEAMVAAAWLHDVLEDVSSVTRNEIEAEFGSEVASLVVQLTDVSRPADGNRSARKARDRDHLAQASPEAQTIKLADLLDNASDILAFDHAFGPIFLKEMDNLLSVLNKGDLKLLTQARQCLEDGYQTIKEHE